MKEYSQAVITEVNQVLKENNGDLVLIGDSDSYYSVVNRKSHMMMLMDNEAFAELLIRKLLENGVEILSDINVFNQKYPVIIRPKPMFWPEDKVWPYQEE